jgi:hypothetical protein
MPSITGDWNNYPEEDGSIIRMYPIKIIKPVTKTIIGNYSKKRAIYIKRWKENNHNNSKALHFGMTGELTMHREGQTWFTSDDKEIGCNVVDPKDFLVVER